MANYSKLTLSQFRFTPTGPGHYYVTYITKGGRQKGALVTDMQLIDATKNSDFPKGTDLDKLRRLINQKNEIP